MEIDSVSKNSDRKITASMVLYARDKFILERFATQKRMSASKLFREILRQALVVVVGAEYARLSAEFDEKVKEITNGITSGR